MRWLGWKEEEEETNSEAYQERNRGNPEDEAGPDAGGGELTKEENVLERTARGVWRKKKGVSRKGGGEGE